MIRALPHPECPGGPRVHPHSSQECAEGPRAHLLRDVIVAGVDAVPEQVLGAAVTAAEVTVVHELPVGAEGTCLPSLPESGAPTQAMGRVSIWYWGCQEGGHRRNAPPALSTQMTVYSKDGGQGNSPSPGPLWKGRHQQPWAGLWSSGHPRKATKAEAVRTYRCWLCRKAAEDGLTAACSLG